MIQSLHGLRILNTRPKNQSHQLSELITKAGGVSIDCPALEIRETNNQWINSLPILNKVDIAIFISTNAVHYCFKQLKEHNISWPNPIKVIAVGNASAKALKHYNIHTHEVPKIHNSEALITLDSLQSLNNQTVLLFKGKGGRLVIEEHALLQEAKLVTLEVYQRVMPVFNRAFVKSIWQDDLVDIILFTSEQSMHHLFDMFGKEALSWLRMKPCLVISERLAESASLFGIKNIVISHPDMMINALFDYSQGLKHDQ